jgi:hypothetical protein
VIAVLLSMIVNTALVSDKVTTAQLQSACVTANGADPETCKAFIVSGANTLLDPNGSFRKICAARSVTYGQFRGAFLDYVEDNPGEADRPAVIVILEAFEKTFPCGAQ